MHGGGFSMMSAFTPTTTATPVASPPNPPPLSFRSSTVSLRNTQYRLATMTLGLCSGGSPPTVPEWSRALVERSRRFQPYIRRRR
ncbi:hypothetical protein ACSBR2_001869 [Camellia fascicularis]